MRISIAQTKAEKGDIEKNLEIHIRYIEKAVNNAADMIVFPELSLTGYEPELARQLATTKSDVRLDSLQELSDKNKLIIGAGLPTIDDDKIFVSMVIFQPDKERIIYSKQYLYPTEVGVFTAGYNPLVIRFDEKNIIAPAICYELSRDEHSETAHKNNATVYIASVLNSVNGIDADLKRLSEIAAKYKMITLMSNYTGETGGHNCAGKSSVWDKQGKLISQLDSKTEGLLIYDTESGQTITERIDY